MRHPLRIAWGLVVVFVVAMVVSAQAMAIVPVKTSKLFEIEPESTTRNGHRLLAWTQTPTTKAFAWNVMLSVNGSRARRISHEGSFSFPDGFDDMGRLIYQQALRKHPNNSDLFMWTVGHASKLPAIVDTARWQYGGDRYGNWLVYGENQFRTRSSPWRILAYNFTTGTKRVLASAKHVCQCVDTGNVSGTLASYRLGRRITVESLGGSPQTWSTAPPKGSFDDYPFVVDPTPGAPGSGDETLIWVRSKVGACGRSVRIMTALFPFTQASTLYRVRRGSAVNSLSVDNSTGPWNVYFGRQTCGTTPTGNIYEIRNAIS